MRTRNQMTVARKGARDQSGLTLIELLVTMSIAVVLTGMILLTWFALQSSFADQARANEARDIARDGMARMVREIRDASSPGIQAVTIASKTRVSFYTTFNDPGDEDTGFGNLMMTTFQYEVGGDGVGRIVRYRDTDNTPGDISDDRQIVIADHVLRVNNAPVFTYWYFDSAGKPSTVWSNSGVVPTGRMQYIYAVEIDLVVDMNGDTQPSPVHLDSVAQIRNARPL
jgi:prepilin-type N-terminal cleavage/methylation domain-containing protein